MRYLRPTRVTTFGGTNIPIGLRCFLEEPFVTYTFGAGVIIESRLGSAEQHFPIVDHSRQHSVQDLLRRRAISYGIWFNHGCQGTSTMATSHSFGHSVLMAQTLEQPDHTRRIKLMRRAL